MKKKTLKKLAINKKTLVNLDYQGMNGVRGGIYLTQTCPDPCQTNESKCTIGCVTVIPHYCEDSALCTQPCW